MLVNLGCGSVYHPDWINLDSIPVSAAVRRWDIRRSLPFQTGEVDACYASHVLEHLPRSNAGELLRECYRILRHGGIIRLVVPDLQNITSNYLKSLNEAGDSLIANQQHQWMTVELLDQMVRRVAGGDMHKMLLDADGDIRNFIVDRIGMEAESVFFAGNLDQPNRFTLAKLAHRFRRIREEIGGLLAGLALGSDGRAALREGLFRRSGQVHQWMYDRVSLKLLLEETGFGNVTICKPDESAIDQFTTFNLDTLNGRVRKPDSLFVEAVRP